MRYRVMIEASDEHTAWGVAVPDLPGCFSAGDTLDEALMAAEEAAGAWTDAAVDAGRAVPSPSSVQDAMGKGDDATLEDIQYHVYVLEKIQRGRADLAAGRRHTTEQARERLARWLSN